MKNKLKATPLVTQLPLGQGKDFAGVIDLVSMDALIWERGHDGSKFTRVPLLGANVDTGAKDFAGIPNLLGPGWEFGDVPVSREEAKEVLECRRRLAEQV